MQEYTTRWFVGQDCIKVSENYIYISKVAFNRLGKPRFIEVWYDTDIKAIKIIPVKEGLGRRTTEQSHGAVHLSLKLGKVMPTGTYFADGDLFRL